MELSSIFVEAEPSRKHYRRVGYTLGQLGQDG